MAKKVKSDLQKFGLTKEIILESLKIVVSRMKKFNQEYGDLGLSRKNISELIGKIMEKACADTFSKKLGYEITYMKFLLLFIRYSFFRIFTTLKLKKETFK